MYTFNISIRKTSYPSKFTRKQMQNDPGRSMTPKAAAPAPQMQMQPMQMQPMQMQPMPMPQMVPMAPMPQMGMTLGSRRAG